MMQESYWEQSFVEKFMNVQSGMSLSTSSFPINLRHCKHGINENRLLSGRDEKVIEKVVWRLSWS